MNTTSRIFGEAKENEYSGYLLKQSTNKNWTKFWCILKDTGLFYYKNKIDTTPVGQIKVFGCEFEKIDVYNFKIINPERTHFFQNNSPSKFA